MSRPQPTARRAGAHDLARIAELEAASFDDPWSVEQVAEQWDVVHAQFWVIESEGHVLGYLLSWLIADEFHVHKVAVDPRERGQGHGSAVVGHALAWAGSQGATTGYLELRASNRAAFGLYARHGFVSVGRRAKYYADGEDAVLMTKRFGATDAGHPAEASS